jgi:hypothetical protein
MELSCNEKYEQLVKKLKAEHVTTKPEKKYGRKIIEYKIDYRY